MYCPRCGNQNENGSAFCSNCGLDLRGKPAAGPAVQPGAAVPPKPRKSRKKAWIIAASALVVVAAAAVGACSIFSGGGSKLGGRYLSLAAPVNYIEFTPDKDDPKHGTYQEVDAGHSCSGHYDIDSENVVTIRDEFGISGADKKMDISGNYLAFEDSVYEGEVPDGETFSATCVNQTDDGTDTFSFRKDGTFTEQNHRTNGTESGTGDSSGTYRRVGDKMMMEYRFGNGNTWEFIFAVYHRQLASEAYVKQ